MKKTKMLQGYEEKKVIKGRIMKTRIPRTNIVRNIISKKVQRVKKVCDDKCKDELAQNNNCSMISTKKNYL